MFWEQWWQQYGNGIIYKAGYSVGILLAAWIGIKLVRGAIRKRMQKHGQRGQTLGTVLGSVSMYVIWTLAILQLAQIVFEISLASVFAAAGVVGVAVGLGAQGLIRDIIGGFFILFEDQLNVGDKVTLEGFTGQVTELGLRSTRLRNEEGDVLILPNSSISKVINHSKT